MTVWAMCRDCGHCYPAQEPPETPDCAHGDADLLFGGPVQRLATALRLLYGRRDDARIRPTSVDLNNWTLDAMELLRLIEHETKEHRG